MSKRAVNEVVISESPGGLRRQIVRLTFAAGRRPRGTSKTQGGEFPRRKKSVTVHQRRPHQDAEWRDPSAE